MSANVTVTADQFSKTLRKMLQQYGEDVFKLSEESAKTAARQSVKELKATSAVGATGRYARGWSHKALRGGVLSYTEIIYNRTDYQLTHLLEHAHPTGYGGQYPKRRDHTGEIAKVEAEYNVKFYEGIVEKL